MARFDVLLLFACCCWCVSLMFGGLIAVDLGLFGLLTHGWISI